MDNNSLFLESIIHSEHKVYGRKQLPLSLFHLAILDKVKSPLITGGIVEAKDIQLAAIICSSKGNKELNEGIRNYNYFNIFYNSAKELKKWEAYYADYMALPEYYEKEGGSKAPQFPFIASFLAKTIKETGWSYEKVFYDTPVGLIIWLNNAFAYLESGETNIISDKEREIFNIIDNDKEP